MRSPFPGMDPYLEAPTRWPGVHHHLLSAIAETLGDALAPAFIVAGAGTTTSQSTTTPRFRRR